MAVQYCQWAALAGACAVQSERVRDSIWQVTEINWRIAEVLLRIANEAGEIIQAQADKGAKQGRRDT
jgi:hypothetical protein